MFMPCFRVEMNNIQNRFQMKEEKMSTYEMINMILRRYIIGNIL